MERDFVLEAEGWRCQPGCSSVCKEGQDLGLQAGLPQCNDTKNWGKRILQGFFCSLMDKNMAMLNLGVQNKEGWSLKLCKSPLNVNLLTFNGGFFRLDIAVYLHLENAE